MNFTMSGDNNNNGLQIATTKDVGAQYQQQFKVKTSNTIQFMRQTSLTKIGGLLNSMNKNRQLQSQLSNSGEREYSQVLNIAYEYMEKVP